MLFWARRISKTLTQGIPILGGVATTYYGTTRGFTGAKNLILGLVTGWLLNVIGTKTDELVKKYRFEQHKLKAAFEYGLKPIVCVGEKLEQREAGIAEEIVTKQTVLALDGLIKEQVKNTIIAYEPIWAIGTGKTATSEDANNMIKAIRAKIAKVYGKDIAEEVIIQYGGSVKSSNATELFSTSDIDGGLVGGASLKPEEFAKIVNYDKQ